MLTIFQAGAAILIVGLGLGSGGVVMLFIGPLFFVLNGLVLRHIGALTFMSILVGLLFLPLPALGPPGFLPKILILLVPAILADVIFSGLKGLKLRLAAWSAGSIMGVGTAASLLILLQFFDIGGVGEFLEIGLVIVGLWGLIGGALGGEVAFRMYRGFKDHPSVRRLGQ